MAECNVNLSLDYNNSHYASPESVDVFIGDTIVFYAVKGSFQVKFSNSQGLFEENTQLIEGIVYQGSKWETPSFKLSNLINYPYEYNVIKIGEELSTTKAPPKRITAVT